MSGWVWFLLGVVTAPLVYGLIVLVLVLLGLLLPHPGAEAELELRRNGRVVRRWER